MLASPLLMSSSDSKLIDFYEIDSDESQAALNHFRLEVALSILMKQSIYIPEGWALDSLCFIIVADEVLSAQKSLKSSSNSHKIGRDFTPFLMETRDNKGHYATLVRYMGNPTCRWSGYRPLREDRAKQAEIFERLQSFDRSDDDSARASHLRKVFSEVLGNRHIADAVANLNEYFDLLFTEKSIRSTIKSGVFERNIRYLFKAVEHSRFSNEETETGRQDLFNEITDIMSHNINLSSSSPIMDHINQEIDPRHQKALMYLCNTAYLKTSSQLSSVRSTSPIVLRNSDHLISVAETVCAKSLGEHEGRIQFEFYGKEKRFDPLLSEAALNADWLKIWQDVIQTAYDREWEAQLNAVRQRYGQGARGKSLESSEEFGKLSDLLEKRCPRLVIKQSAADRISLHLLGKQMGKKTGDFFDKTFGKLSKTLVGGAIGAFYGPTYFFVGSALGYMIEKIGDAATSQVNLKISPFSKDSRWAKRTTLLDNSV